MLNRLHKPSSVARVASGLVSFILVFGQPGLVLAGTGAPRILNYQGRLMDSSGTLLGGVGTEYCFKFSLYDNQTVGSGSKVWPSGAPSPMTATVKNGVFSVGVGDTNAGGDVLNYDFQSSDTVFLNVEVATRVGPTCAPGDGAESFETLSPRNRIDAAGYAINANTVGGFTPSQEATGSQVPVLSSGRVVLGSAAAGITATSSNALTIQGASTGDINFFNTNNRLTSSGDLTLAGLLTSDRINFVNGTSTSIFTNLLAASAAAFGATATSSFNAAGQLILAGAPNGPLQANAGVVSATTTIGVVYGGTGISAIPTFGQLLLGNGSGGYALSATSTLGLPTFASLSSYLSLSAWYATTTDALAEGTTNKYFTVDRVSAVLAATTTDALAEGSTNKYYTDGRATTNFVANLSATTSVASITTLPNLILPAGQLSGFGVPFYSFFSATTTDALGEGSTNLYYTTARANANFVANLAATTSIASITNLPNLSITSSQVSDLDSSVNSYIAASSTVAKTYANTTFTGALAAAGGFTVGSLTGPLQANNGVVSATSTLSIAYGGTGTSSAPSYGKLLLGNSAGTYDLVSTSSLGINSGVWGAITGNIADQTDLQNALATKLNLSAWYSTTTDQLQEGTNNLYFTTARGNTNFANNLAATTTTALAEGSNLYFTTARATTSFIGNLAATTSVNSITTLANLTLPATQLSGFGIPFYQFFAATTTDALAQGSTNKYYSSALFAADLAATTSVNSIIALNNLVITASQVSDFNTATNSYINASTTIPKTYTNNTFAGTNTFNGNTILANATSTNLFAIAFTALDGIFGDLIATTSANLASTTAQGRFITGNIVSTSTATSTFGGPLTIGIANGSYQASILGSTTAATSATGTAVLAVSNDNNTLSSGTNVLRLNLRTAYGTACVTGTTCPRFMEFFTGLGAGTDTGGRGVGSLRLSTAGTGITQTSGSADFAEYMLLNSAASAGDLVSLNAQGEYQKAVAGQSLVGVISENPAFVGNANIEGQTNAYIVGFAGVVPTTVSTANGPIDAGDLIAASTTPGVGVKLVSSGFALGQALQAYSGVGNGTINVLVMPKYIDAAVALESYGGTRGGVSGYWNLSTTTGQVSLASTTYSLVVNTVSLTAASTTNFSSSYASSTRAFFGSLSVGNLSGILRATGGAVSTGLVNLASEVTGVLPIANGGTGTSTTPSYGRLLLGNAAGGYDLVATSSLGINSGVWGAITGNIADQTDLQNALATKLNLSAWYSTTTDQLQEGTNNLYFTAARANANFAQNLAATTTTALAEGNNLYFTTARATTSFIGNLAATTSVNSITTLANLTLPATQLSGFGIPFYQFFAATTTDALAQGSTNKYYSSALFAADLAATTSVNSIIALNNLVITASQVSDFNTATNAYIHASTTIPKTYTNNTFAGTQTFQNASTTNISASYASSTNLVAGTATTTALAISGLSSSLLKVNALGQVAGAIAGTDYLAPAALNSYLQLTDWYSTTTDQLEEGTNNLYFTTARATTSFVGNLAATTSVASITTLPNLLLPATQLSGFGVPFYSFFSATTTDALSEGSSNLYFTTTRATNNFISNLAATTSVNSITTLNNLSITASQVSNFASAATSNFVSNLAGTTSVSSISSLPNLSLPASQVTGLFGYLFPNNATTSEIAFSGGLTASRSTTTEATTTRAFAGNVNANTAFFGASATSSFASNGALTLAQQLTVGNGGTGATSFTYGLLGSNGGTNALVNFATSSLGLLSTNVAEGSNLYYQDSRVEAYIAGSTTIPKTYTANTFTNTNTFNGQTNLGYASSTGISSGYASSTSGFFGSLSIGSLSGILKATAGAVSTALVNLTTDVTGVLSVANGGTGWAAIQSGAIPYGNGSGALATTTAGTAGQVLALLNGVPTWTSTTTFSYPFQYSAGNVTLAFGTTTANIWSSLQQFNGNASSTALSALDALQVGRNATTTIRGESNATSTFAGGVQANALNVTSTSASSTFGNGIDISHGCFSVNGTCISGGGGGGGSGTLINIRVFSSPGTTTYTPSAGATVAYVVVTGGGGGGGAANSPSADTTNETIGGGGGAGGTSIGIIDLTSTSSVQVVVGQGGAGGTAGVATANNGSGGSYSFIGTYASSTGGNGGGGAAVNATGCATNGAIGAAGTGGTSAKGSINFDGGTGLSGSCAAEAVIGGTGGSSYWGEGGAGAPDPAANGSSAGVSATTFGGGGGGAASEDSSGTGASGGNGANGAVVVYEYGPFTGVMTVANGGTGWTDIQAGTLLTGNGTGAIATTTIGNGLSLAGGILSTSFGTTTANTFTALQSFMAGASSSALSALDALQVGRNATTTIRGEANATSTFAGGVQAAYLNLTGSSATSTASSGFNITSGCFAINGVCISGSGSSGILALGSGYASTTNTAITFSTTTLAFNGLTFGQTITASNGALTFTPTISGILGIAAGGTGTTTLPVGQLLYGGTNTYQSVGTSTVGTNASLSVSGTLGYLVGGSNSTISLNLGNANAWTALQQFSNASSSIFSAYRAYFGGTATTTIDNAGNVVVGGTLTANNATSSNQFAQNYTGNTAAFGGTATTTIDTNGNTAVAGTLNVTGKTTLGNASTTNISASYASSTQGFFGSLSVGALTGVLRASAGAITTGAVNLASEVSGVLSVASGGTGWANIQAGTLVTGNGTGAVATTSIGSSLQISGSTLSLNLSNANIWTGLQTFTNSSTTIISAYRAYFGGTATTTIDGAGNVVIGGSLTSKASDTILASTTATRFTVQNATSTNATSTTLYISGSLTGAGLSTCSNGTNDKLLWNSGTGQFSCGVDQGGAGGGISTLGAAGQLQNGASQTFATSTDANLGLTITSSANTHTFTTIWNGILAVARGGTGWGNIQAGTLLTGNGTGAVATTSIGSSLQISSNSLSLNLANNNIWTGLQQFQNASTTLLETISQFARTIQSTSTNALVLKTSLTATAGLTLGSTSTPQMLALNTTDNRVTIGTGGSSPTLFVLDNKNTTGDPAGINGATYFNSNDGLWRCYASGWRTCGGQAASSTGAIQFTGSDGGFAGTSNFLWNIGANGLTIQAASSSQTTDLFTIASSTGTAMFGVSSKGVLEFASTTDPVTPPSGQLNVYAKDIAGRMLPKWIGPSGVDTPFQANLGFNRVSMVMPAGGATATTFVGGIGSTFTNVVTTAANPTPATTNLLTSTRRATFSTNATANTITSHRQSTLQVTRGNASNIGGFFYTIRFGTSVTPANCRVFVGLSDSVAAPTNIDPLVTGTGIGRVGVAINTNTGNWSFVHNVSGTAPTVTNLGASFPVDNTSLYELILFAAPNDTVIHYRFKNLATGAETSGQTLTTNIPTNTTYLAPQFWMVNVAASIATFDFGGWYLESDQ